MYMIDIDFEHFETQVHVPQFPTFSMKSLHTKRPPVCCCFVGFFVVVGCFFGFFLVLTAALYFQFY